MKEIMEGSKGMRHARGLMRREVPESGEDVSK